jgi:hypothetical protein
MRALAMALTVSAIALSLPAAASASPLFLRCSFTKERVNPLRHLQFKFRVWERVKIDPQDHIFAESEQATPRWTNQCDQPGYECRFDERRFSVTAKGPRYRLTTSIDRYTRKFNSESEDDDLVSMSYGSCTQTVDPEPSDVRQF